MNLALILLKTEPAHPLFDAVPIKTLRPNLANQLTAENLLPLLTRPQA